ncbi:hypothetical protein AA313_de0203593 [Arthrobotrys entomopaga]|nr:hypothetical protein AA313_de0203593 [Arthrobotrys entomopaga]
MFRASALKLKLIRGSTMGSRKEFAEMVQFIDKNKIKPVVSSVVRGLDRAEEVFEAMKNGTQFGKLVVEVDVDGADSSKL